MGGEEWKEGRRRQGKEHLPRHRLSSGCAPDCKVHFLKVLTTGVLLILSKKRFFTISVAPNGLMCHE